MRSATFLLILICSFARSELMDELTAAEDVFKAGLKLVGLEKGLHLLEDHPAEKDEVVIAIHGVATLGYEWVYPLSKLNHNNNLVAFYRWAPVSTSCANDEAAELLNIIENDFNEYATIKLVGHSAGGVLVSKIIDSINTDQEIEAHIIASPLKGSKVLNKACNYSPIQSVQDNVSLYEWRTQKKLDAVYRFMIDDPQIVEITGSIVTSLPDKYGEYRLGHNRSISWVVDKITTDKGL